MPYNKKTLQETIDEIHNDLVTALEDANPELRDSMLLIFSKAYAGALNAVEAYLEWKTRQMYPDTADPENSGHWGSIKKIQPLTANTANGTATVTGTEGSGVSLNAELRRGDGTLFETTESVVIPASGTIDVAVQAQEPGTAGNTGVGETLTFVSVPTGVSSTVEIVSMTGGTEDETAAEYAERVNDSFANPARGGNNNDYQTWAKEATDVTNVWVYGYHPSNNPHNILLGDVLVYFMMYDTYPDGVPQAGDVTQVQNYIDERKPEGMGQVTVAAPSLEPLDMTISITPNTLDNQTDVENQLKDMLKRNAQPNGTIRQSMITEAIGRAKDVDYYTLTSPSGDVTVSAAENIFVLGTITWS